MKIHSQNGNALFIILIVTAIFGALSFTVADMMRGGSPDVMSTERARLHANEIIDFARATRQSVQSIRISNSCEAADISFTVTGSDGYQHGSADTCKVFHASGGGRNNIDPVTEWLDSSMSAENEYGEWFYDGNHCIQNVGSTASPCVAANNELLLVLPHISRNICVQINEALGVTNPSDVPPTENHDNSATKFQGTYTAGANALITSTELDGKIAACFQDNAGDWANSYIFYQVLIAR